MSSTAIDLPGSRPTLSSPRSSVSGSAPHRDEDLLSSDALTVVQGDGDTLIVPVDGLRLGSQVNLHTTLKQGIAQLVACERLLA